MAKGRKTGGRKKGTPNKINGDLRGMILEALSNVGGVAYLQDVAQTDRRAFCALIGRTLPLAVQGDPNAPLIPGTIEVRIVDTRG